MPVPVPVYTKPSAHRVIKINHPAHLDTRSSTFSHLTTSLPRPPQGPPPSFASRDEWINSLPSWRRNKDRRAGEDDPARFRDSSQGFEAGLTVAGNATAIKGARVQTCIPPNSMEFSSHVSPRMYDFMDEDMDEATSGYSTGESEWQSEQNSYARHHPSPNFMQYDGAPANSPTGDMIVEYATLNRSSGQRRREYNSADAYSANRYARGTFSPVYEDSSPEPISGMDPASSPIGPPTPFADYVDKIVSESQPIVHARHSMELVRRGDYRGQEEYPCYQCQSYPSGPAVIAPPAPQPVAAPTATAAYKRLAAPLSEWLVGYVWKVCTTGMHLPDDYAQPMAFVKHYSASPPSHLAASTHSMLLSTLLQPSAVFLALWYIIRLPVFFGPVGLGADHVKEIRFRAELLGEAHLAVDRDAIEAYAPFRLIILGCMLANKWLDDHTFSNKTWHTISNIPIRSLNKLESLALDIFSHDLSIPTQDWNSWLTTLHGYHASLSSPLFPQPISRPSTSPHAIVRQALDTLVNARGEIRPYHSGDAMFPVPPVPIFVGMDDRRGSREEDYEREDTMDVLEIDLDEDGPLREEYLPRRRTSNARQSHRVTDGDRYADRSLPPPAKWSPAGDEPIIRDPARGHGQYVAPQPLGPIIMQAPPPPVFQSAHRGPLNNWPLANSVPYRPEPTARPECAPPGAFSAPYTGYEYPHPAAAPHGHSRSQSLSYNQATGASLIGRVRSFSHTHFEPGYGNTMSNPSMALPPPPMTTQWTAYDHVSFPTSYDRPFQYQQPPPLKV